jgi:tetratricopeptide (TPR) repeat protein
MLKIFNAIKSKALTTSGPAPMDALSQAKNSTLGRDESRQKQAEVLYREALSLIDHFRAAGNDPEYLLKAAEKLEESLRFNYSRGETHFWLAFILYNFGQVKGALTYLKKAESLSPEFPQIKQLKEIISNT